MKTGSVKFSNVVAHPRMSLSPRDYLKGDEKMRCPVCVECECDMKPECNGVWVIETAGEERRPYKVWYGDKVRCPVCGVEIVVGFGRANDADESDRRRLEDDFIYGPIYSDD